MAMKSIQAQCAFIVLVAHFFALHCNAAITDSLPLGFDSIHASNGLCLMLGAKVEAGDFFKGLRAHKTHGDRVFRKHGKVIHTFPDSLTIYLAAGYDNCAGRGTPVCDRCDFRFNRDFMQSLRFQAYWKHGFETKETAIRVLSLERSNDLEEIAPSAELWKYQLAVEGRNIPITDALVLTVLDSHGRIVTRLSGKL